MSAKKVFKSIIWPVIYMVLIVAVCVSAAMVFHSYYYTAIYVSGSSMAPTLQGDTSGMVDYGIIDTHDSAINHLKRFQIITTYYPFSTSKDYIGGYTPGGENKIDENNASYKIKRVYAFPGECFKLVPVFEEDGSFKTVDFYVKTGEFAQWPEEPLKIKFDRKMQNTNGRRSYTRETPLGENEYWVMGDNYDVSFDCYNANSPIYKDNIVGVLVAIEGRCKISMKSTSDDDGTHVSATCTNRQRHWPKYF